MTSTTLHRWRNWSEENLSKLLKAHSSTLAWKLPWMEEPGGLQSMGSRRVRHDWTTSLSLFTFMHWRRKWQPTPAFLPGESQGQRSLVGCRLWGRLLCSRTWLKQLIRSSSSGRLRWSTWFVGGGNRSFCQWWCHYLGGPLSSASIFRIKGVGSRWHNVLYLTQNA